MYIVINVEKPPFLTLPAFVTLDKAVPPGFCNHSNEHKL